MSKLDSIVGIILTFLFTCIAGMLYWNQEHQFPDFSENTLFYIGVTDQENGRLVALDRESDTKTFLTSEDMIINQFLLDDDEKIFFLAFPRSALKETSFRPDSYQDLYELDIATAKLRKISSASDYAHHNMMLHPSRPYLLVERADEETIDQQWWIYDIQKHSWKLWLNNRLLFDIHLSADGSTLLAADVMSEIGYVMTSFSDTENNITPVGNFDQSFGFNNTGEKMLFGDREDVFSSESHLIVFNADGSSSTFLEDDGSDVVHAFWSKNEHVFFALLRNLESSEERIITVNTDTGTVETLLEVNDTVKSLSIGINSLFFVQEENGVYTIYEYDFETKQILNRKLRGVAPQMFSY